MAARIGCGTSGQWWTPPSATPSAGAGGYILYFSGQRVAVMGNVLSDSSAAEHVLRTPYIFKGVFSHNDMSKPARDQARGQDAGGIVV